MKTKWKERQSLVRMVIVVAIVSTLSAPANAQDARPAATVQCRGIADPAARLACYDRANTLQPHGDQQNKSVHWSEFGSRETSNTPPSRLPTVNNPVSTNPTLHHSVVAEVTDFSTARDGRFTVVLDNGQIWRQLPADEGIAQFKEHGRNHVVISRGFWRSYDMKLNDMNAVFKVERVQ